MAMIFYLPLEKCGELGRDDQKLELFIDYKAVFKMQVSLYHGTVQTWHIVLCFCFVFLRLVCPVDCPFLLAPLVFSNDYFMQRLSVTSSGYAEQL